MKIAVTGASGFVGQPVCAQLMAAGHTVRAIVRSAQAPEGLAGSDVLTGCDLEQASTWDAAAAGVDVIVHLAARAHAMSDDPNSTDALYRRANVHVTEGLARAALRHGVKRFVYMSSIKVNGERTGARPFTPDDTPAPEDAYGRSKLEAEKSLAQIAAVGAMETVIVRPPLLYGPRMRGNMLRLFQIVQSGLPLPFSSIRNARDILYVGNLAALVEVLTRHPAAAGRVFLARDGAPLSTPALATAIGAAMGRAPWYLPVPVGLLRLGARLAGAGGTASRLTEDLRIDDQTTRTLLGWQPPTGASDALGATATWFQSETR